MKTMEALRDELEMIIGRHYYSEDFELVPVFQSFVAGLRVEEREVLAEVIMSRLSSVGSLVDILLCGVVDVPAAVPVLAERLNQENQTNQVTRALIASLGRYTSDEAYRAVERFLDSDQEMEALQVLGRIDFARSLPYLARCMVQLPAQGVVLHIFHAYAKAHGMEALIRVVQQSSVSKSTAFRNQLKATLQAKSDAYNPFTPSEREQVMQAFQPV